MVYASRSHHGGFALGVGAFGRAVWAQREPGCHRWRVWRGVSRRALYNVFRVRGGRIVEVTDFARRGDAFAAVGAHPPGWL